MDTNFGILGPTALRIDGSWDENWGPPRERALLAALLVHANKVVPIDALIGWAWRSDTPVPRNPMSTFHTYSARIRRSLRRLPVAAELRAVNGGYRLDVDRDLVDYHRFQHLFTNARAGVRTNSPAETVAILERALDLWRGVPLHDLANERADAWRVRVVRNEWLPAKQMLVDALLAGGELERALTILDEVRDEFPHDVKLAMQRLSTLHGLARGGEATRYYLTTRRLLLDEGDEQAAELLRGHQDALRETYGEHRVAPPVRAVTAPHLLPHDIPRFVGRATHLARLDATANPLHNGDPVPGVVILDGMPGVGKTALAVHWGHHARRLFPDGDLYANLNGFSEGAILDAATVVDDFLIALDHPPDSTMDSRSRQLLLSKLLTGRRTLVVLDNARNSAHVRPLVALLSSCFVIVTSRQRLSTLQTETGARRIPVEPLDAEESGALLNHHIDADQAEPVHVREIAARCGGLPLVINVVGQHVASRPAAALRDIAGQLDSRAIITDLGDDGDGRTTAQAFFTWSYQALAEPERRLFRLLALCPGTDFSSATAYACDGRGADTKRGLRALVGAHLLEQPGATGRYRFHDLLREFATQCLEADEPAETRAAAIRRMLSCYVASAANAARSLYPSHPMAPQLPPEQDVEPLRFTDAGQARAWLDQERMNLVAAVELAAAGHPEHAWRLADPVARYFDRCGYHDDSRMVREHAVRSARATRNREAEASALISLGMSHLIAGAHQAARSCLGTALTLVEEDGNERGQASALHQLARLEMLQGNPSGAVALYHRCLTITQRIGDLEGQSWTHYRLGEVLRGFERHEQAVVHLHEASWLAQRIGDRSAHASSLAELGRALWDRGDHRAAAAHCETALRIAEAIPDRAATARAYIALAEINRSDQHTSAAVRYARRAVDLSRYNVAGEANAQAALGSACHADGDRDGAVRAWQRAAELFQRTGNLPQASAVRSKLSSVTTGDAGVPEARTFLDEETSTLAMPRQQDAHKR